MNAGIKKELERRQHMAVADIAARIVAEFDKGKFRHDMTAKEKLIEAAQKRRQLAAGQIDYDSWLEIKSDILDVIIKLCRSKKLHRSKDRFSYLALQTITKESPKDASESAVNALESREPIECDGHRTAVDHLIDDNLDIIDAWLSPDDPSPLPLPDREGGEI